VANREGSQTTSFALCHLTRFVREFADAAYVEVEAGKLDRQSLYILDRLRAWEEGGIWTLAYVR